MYIYIYFRSGLVWSYHREIGCNDEKTTDDKNTSYGKEDVNVDEYLKEIKAKRFSVLPIIGSVLVVHLPELGIYISICIFTYAYI
jgi:hypothetical protein